MFYIMLQGKGRGKGAGGIEASATALQLGFENAVLELKSLLTAACKGKVKHVVYCLKIST